MASRIRWGDTSRCILALSPNRIIRRSAATRTRKNSSRLLEKMPRNLMRSGRGTPGSAASWSTRALKDSQLMSRGIVDGGVGFWSLLRLRGLISVRMVQVKLYLSKIPNVKFLCGQGQVGFRAYGSARSTHWWTDLPPAE